LLLKSAAVRIFFLAEDAAEIDRHEFEKNPKRARNILGIAEWPDVERFACHCKELWFG
jgi:hypothetical protein